MSNIKFFLGILIRATKAKTKFFSLLKEIYFIYIFAIFKVAF